MDRIEEIRRKYIIGCQIQDSEMVDAVNSIPVLFAEIDSLQAKVKGLKNRLVELIDNIAVPEKDCSCLLVPPICDNCWTRSLVERARREMI